MAWAKRVIVISVAVIAAIVVIVFAALLVGPPKPEFELTSWEIATNGTVSIEFTYSTDKPVEVVLINPYGAAVGYAFLSAEATHDAVDMAPFDRTPDPGAYKMIVKYLDEPIFEEYFTFSGAGVSIGTVSLEWSYNEIFDWYTLESVTVELVNDGDLPAYALGISGLIDGKKIAGKLMMDWIESGKETISWSEGLTYVEKPGIYTLDLIIERIPGAGFARRTVTIQVP